MAAVIEERTEDWRMRFAAQLRTALRQRRVRYSISRRELSDVTKEVARLKRAKTKPSKRITLAQGAALRRVSAARRSLIEAIRMAELHLNREIRAFK